MSSDAAEVQSPTRATSDNGNQSPPALKSPGGGTPGYVQTPAGLLEKEFLPMTTEECRSRLSAIRDRRRELAEEMEQLQEEEARIMAQMRRSSSVTSILSRRGSLQEAPLSPKLEEDSFKATLTPEELQLLKHLEHIIEMSMKDQPSCREAQKSVDAIMATEGADVAAVPPLEGFEDPGPSNMSAADATKIASAGGAATPALRLKQRELLVKLMNKRHRELITDQYGNYFLQRAFNRCTADELQTFLETASAELPEFSCNMHGTRAVQRLIDCCTTDSHYELFCESIANEVVPMVCDLNASHVVQRLLLNSNFKETEKENIFHIIMLNCVEIGMNKQGCCMIQRCLESAPTNFRAQMINALIQNTLQLVQDPFGNYVIQFVLDLPQDQLQQNSTTSLANRVIRQVLHHIGTLSCNKFSSNVIEKCLRASTPEVRQLLLDEVTDPATLPKLLVQSYANYVVQTALMISDENQFQQLKDAIQPLHHLLKNSPYGIKIEAKIAKRSREIAKKRGGGGGSGGGGGTSSASNAGGENRNGRRRQRNSTGNNGDNNGGGAWNKGGQQPQPGQHLMQQQHQQMPQQPGFPPQISGFLPQQHQNQQPGGGFPQNHQQQQFSQHQHQPQPHYQQSGQHQHQHQYQTAAVQQTGYGQYQADTPQGNNQQQFYAQPQQQFDTQQYYQQQQQQQQHQAATNNSFSHSPYAPAQGQHHN